MIVRINGKNEEIEQTSTLLDMINSKELCPERIVVEHNGKIVRRDKLNEVPINNNDVIEIVSFVGGG